MNERGSVRFCQSCGARLARDHDLARCASCQRRVGDLALAPPEVPGHFWTHERMREALNAWHIGQVIRVYRHHSFHEAHPLSQELVAGWLGLTQTQLSRIENGPPVKDLDKLIHWARTLRIPTDLLWFKLPSEADRSRQAFTLPVMVHGKPVLLPIDVRAAWLGGLYGLLEDLGNGQQSVPEDVAHALPTGDPEELERIAAALDDARRYLDGSVVNYLRMQLDRSKDDDGKLGAARALPLVLGILGAISQHVRDVKPEVRSQMLSLGADGAEFAGWLSRDLQDHPSATYWYDRAMEWAQEAGDTAMQGYVLLKKSQMAYDRRDAVHVVALAQAASDRSWRLPGKVRAELLESEAIGLAMLGESLSTVERKLDEASAVLGSVRPDEQDGPSGAYFTADTLLLRQAACYTEAGKPAKAALLFDNVITRGGLSRRDVGFFRARQAAALALSGEPDEAAAVGLRSAQVAKETNSERTLRVLAEVSATLTPWRSRPGPQALKRELATSAR
jgi:transcriptional regulator with XRE-family HTH domain